MSRPVVRPAVASIVSAILTAAVYATDLPDTSEWVRLDVEEYRIFSNAGEARTRQAAQQLLQFREALASTTDLELRFREPIRIFVFRNGRDFSTVREAMFDPRSTRKPGVFVGRGEVGYIAIDASADHRSYGLIYHELTHLYLRRSVPGAPLWFDEGLAEFYSTFAVSGDRATIGAPIVPHVRYLRRTSRPMRLSRLLTLTNDSAEYRSGAAHTSIYAQSWLLVHYLTADPERARQMRAFVRAARSQPAERAFLETFGMKPAEMEPQLRIHARRLFFPQQLVRVSIAEHSVAGDLIVVPRDELLSELGDFLMCGHTGGRAMAEQMFAAALQVNPGNSSAHAGLALLADLRRDLPTAAEHYRQALQIDSGGYQTPLFAAESSLRSLFANYPQGGAPAAEVESIRNLFRLAIERAPEQVRGYSGLGKTFMFEESGSLLEGVTALETAWAMERAPAVALNLAILYARLGDAPSTERHLAAGAAAGADDLLLRRAREAVEIAPLYQINALLVEGRERDALRLIDGILREAPAPGLRAALEREATRIDDQVCHHEQAEIFNRAVGHANQGDFDAALRVLDSLPQATLSAQVQEASDRLRQRISVRVVARRP